MPRDLKRLNQLLKEKQAALDYCNKVIANTCIESRQRDFPADWNGVYGIVANYCYNRHYRTNLLSNINQIKQRIKQVELTLTNNGVPPCSN